jgi:hypothetical protein
MSFNNVIIHFWPPSGPMGWMSNWSYYKITEDGKSFPTMEHYMIYHKAILMGDEMSAARILGMRIPSEVKRVGRHIIPFDEKKWHEHREAIVIRGLRLKRDQHESIREKLIQTRDAILAEASPYDAIWGIGIFNTHEHAFDPSRWPGQNLLGKCWMVVREECRT